MNDSPDYSECLEAAFSASIAAANRTMRTVRILEEVSAAFAALAERTPGRRIAEQ